jgi:hypothetical protein
MGLVFLFLAAVASSPPVAIPAILAMKYFLDAFLFNSWM